MSRIRPIEKPAREGTHVTLSDARAAFRDLKNEEANELTLPGLGKLTVSQRKARTGRNPATGEAIQTPARKISKFRIAKAAKDAIIGKK